MLRLRSSTLAWIITVFLVALPIGAAMGTTTSGCVKAPPNFSPSGQAAWYGLQAVRSLDLLRDTAISANAQTPPILSEASTRRVVLYHKAAVSTIGATPQGWKATVLQGLVELEPTIPEPERATLAPYIRLLKSILETIP